MKKIVLFIVIAGIAFVKFLPSTKIDASSVDTGVINSNVNIAELNAITDPKAQAGLRYYLEKTQDDTEISNLEPKVQNFGCHSEIYIYKSGELVMRMAYFGGTIYEI